MGNNRFKLAEMISSTWFYKLKDSSRSVNTSNSSKTPNEALHHNSKEHVPPSPQPVKPRRPSYYISSNEYKFPNSPINLKVSDTKYLIDSPRKSKERPNTIERVPKDAGLFIEIDLPPILTKPAKEKGYTLPFNKPKSPIRPRKVTSSYRKKKSNGGSRKWGAFSKSFAVVKCSSDPKKDFRESMVEMIVENEIYKAKDLEELLACFLKLNSDEYHDLILTVFEQVWIDLCYIKRKHANA